MCAQRNGRARIRCNLGLTPYGLPGCWPRWPFGPFPSCMLTLARCVNDQAPQRKWSQATGHRCGVCLLPRLRGGESASGVLECRVDAAAARLGLVAARVARPLHAPGRPRRWRRPWGALVTSWTPDRPRAASRAERQQPPVLRRRHVQGQDPRVALTPVAIRAAVHVRASLGRGLDPPTCTAGVSGGTGLRDLSSVAHPLTCDLVSFVTPRDSASACRDTINRRLGPLSGGEGREGVAARAGPRSGPGRDCRRSWGR